ncbi:hypothetical protein BH18ACI4_BH18ACI4_06390 [soil metagenome]
MGAVYEATDGRLSRTVALKETLADSDELRHAFEREARLLANLNHASLPRVLDHFSEGTGQYLVMDYVPGSDFKALLEQQGHPFPLSDVLRWAHELLDALEYLHSNEPPIIHRDIKPSNLKLNSKGKIVLLDFGLAKGTAGQMKAETLSKSILGYSPHYAPLEQIQGGKTTPRSDLYALASTLYHLLTGRVPTDALTRATAMLDDEPDPLPALSSVNSKIPSRLASILMQALALKPSLRPASARAMRTSLVDAYGPAAMVPMADEEDHEATVVGMTPIKVRSISSKGDAEEKTELPRTARRALLPEHPPRSRKKAVLVACMFLLILLGLVGVMVLPRLSGSADQNIGGARTEPTPKAVDTQNLNENSPNGPRSSSASSPGPQETAEVETSGEARPAAGDTGSASSKSLDKPVKLKSPPPNGMLKELRSNLSGSGIFYGSLSALEKKTTASSVDLNGDGEPEFIVSVSDACGSSGNCEYWVFRKRGESYELMLNDTYLEPMKTITNGYRDLQATGTSGAYDMFLRFYKFNGRHYRKTKCAERSYDHEKRRWITTIEKCD